MGVVIASSAAALDERQPAELAAPDDQRLVEQAAAFEIRQKGRDRLIGLPREAGVVGGDVHVAVPASFVFLAAGVDLDEAHAALDQPAGDQALLGEVLT